MLEHLPGNYYGIEMSALKFLMGDAETVIEPTKPTLSKDASKALRNRGCILHNQSVSLQPDLVQGQTLTTLNFNCFFFFLTPLLP